MKDRCPMTPLEMVGTLLLAAAVLYGFYYVWTGHPSDLYGY